MYRGIMLTIGTIKLDNPFVLAPLAGITDVPMRRLAKEQGAAMVFSEMISAKGLWYNDKNTERLLLTNPEEQPLMYQLFGSEPDIMAAARLILLLIMLWHFRKSERKYQ